MKILATGANGYLGVGIVKTILDNGHEVVAADFDDDCVDKRADKRPCNILKLKMLMIILEKRMFYSI